MRLTGGEFGGRNLLVPKSDAIRPTQDRVREALFNILAPEIAGSVFLDLFAGSGAVGLEALSRGAKAVTFVEQNRRHVEVLKKNLGAVLPGRTLDSRPSTLAGVPGLQPSTFNLQPAATTVAVADCYRWLATYVGPGFTIGFADPPYALGEEKGYASVLATLAARGVIRPDGLFVAEMTAVQRAEETPGWDLLRDRTYGKTRLCIWRRLQKTNDYLPQASEPALATTSGRGTVHEGHVIAADRFLTGQIQSQTRNGGHGNQDDG